MTPLRRRVVEDMQVRNLSPCTQDTYIRQVGLWLGHTSLKSTEMYARADTATKLGILAARQPPNLRKGSCNGVHDELRAMLGIVAARLSPTTLCEPDPLATS